LVSDAPDRADGPAFAVLDLFAETLDMYVYRAGIANVLIAPDVVEKLLPGKYLVGGGGQEIEEFQLLGRHLHGMSLVKNGIVGQVDHQVGIFHKFPLLPA